VFLPRSTIRPDRLDLETARELHRAITSLRQVPEGAVPFARLQTAVAPMVEAMRRLLVGRQPAAVRQELCTAAAHCFSFAARVAFELHDDASASACTTTPPASQPTCLIRGCSRPP